MKHEMKSATKRAHDAQFIESSGHFNERPQIVTRFLCVLT